MYKWMQKRAKQTNSISIVSNKELTAFHTVVCNLLEVQWLCCLKPNLSRWVLNNASDLHDNEWGQRFTYKSNQGGFHTKYHVFDPVHLVSLGKNLFLQFFYKLDKLANKISLLMLQLHSMSAPKRTKTKSLLLSVDIKNYGCYQERSSIPSLLQT